MFNKPKKGERLGKKCLWCMDTLEKKESITFNGFSSDEIVDLYKFLCAYEKIEPFHKDNSLERNYPVLSEKLFSLLCQLPLKSDNCITIVKDDLNIKYTPAHRNKFTAFLYHFRNAIAHGRVFKKDQIEIKDFDNSTLTAYGLIDRKIGDEIIKLLIKELL